MLPTSYTLPSQLLEIDSMPFGSGGSGDVYMGTLDGSKVCVRRIRKYIQDVARVVAGVGLRPHFLRLQPLSGLAGLLQGGHNMEAPSTPERLTSSGCHYLSLPTCFEMGA